MEEKFAAIGLIYIFCLNRLSFILINRANLAKSGGQTTRCTNSAL